MDTQTALELSNLTTRFYAHVHDSFSQTRQAPWAGWEHVLHVAGILPRSSVTVLDLACGNLRFERFLAGRTAGVRAWCVDNCDELAGMRTGAELGADADAELGTGAGDLAEAAIRYQHVDLARDPSLVEAPPCDLCVCFGFMHHLPLAEQRLALLRTLVRHARPGGHVAVSFWQFERDGRIMGKARPLASQGDYLLGWQGQEGVARYCHSFSDQEIDDLIARMGPQAREVARFGADGKSNNLNRYLVLRACPHDEVAQTAPCRASRHATRSHHRRNS